MNQANDGRTAASPLPKLLIGLLALAGLLVVPMLYAIFAIAPVEEQMGIVQKVFYFHVPCANAMYLGFIVSAVCSGVYLAKRDDRWDAVAVAGAEVGMAFCLAVLISGPLWARKAWGVWWTWDPRLTTTLLAALVYVAYLVLRSFGGGEVEKRFAAGLSIIGLIDIPLIKYSVQRWRGTHPTVITEKGGGIHADMVPALLLSFLFFAALAVAFIWLRARAERVRQQLQGLEVEAASAGLLEENA
jgi:heme exporter protein C